MFAHSGPSLALAEGAAEALGAWCAGGRGRAGLAPKRITSLSDLFCPLPLSLSGSESQEEIIQNIARQLAQIGDTMECRIPPTLVNRLAAEFMNGNLSEEVSEKTPSVFSRLAGKCGGFLHCHLNQGSLSSVSCQTNVQ